MIMWINATFAIKYSIFCLEKSITVEFVAKYFVMS